MIHTSLRDERELERLLVSKRAGVEKELTVDKSWAALSIDSSKGSGQNEFQA